MGIQASKVFRLTTAVALFAGLVASYSPASLAQTAATTTIRVNVGGPAYTDSASRAWRADTGYNTGSAHNVATATIAGTSDPALYRDDRFDTSTAPEMQYSFAVPAGKYAVRLHFAELNSKLFNVGRRVFDVHMEGQTMFPGLDIYAQAGANTALIKSATVDVSDGTLNIGFVHRVDNPVVSAIEIIGQQTIDSQAPTIPTGLVASAASTSQMNLRWTASTDNVGVSAYLLEACSGSTCTNFSPVATVTGTTSYAHNSLAAGTTYRYRVRARDAAGNLSSYSSVVAATTTAATSTPTQLPTIRVNVGGPAYTDSASRAWRADTGYNTGSAHNVATATIAGTSDPALYRDDRFDTSTAPEMQYSFAVPAGKYAVRLHFAELNSKLFNVGRRVFDVQMEGQTMFPGLDIYAQAGANTALIKSATVDVSDGTLNIGFVHKVDNPVVSAIEIIGQQTTTDSQAPTIPSSLVASAASTTQMNLNWTASTDNVGVSAYLLEACSGSTCTGFSQIATVSGTSYTHSSLTAGTTYRYRARARDAAGNLSSYSSVVSATITLNNTPPVLSGTPSTSVEVGKAYSFAPQATDANGDMLAFAIQNKPSWATFSTVTGALAGTPSIAGAYSGITISVSDGKASVALQAFTINVTSATVPSVNTATMTWTPPTTNTDGSVLTDLAGYRIVYGTSPSAMNTTIQVSPGLTSYVISDLAPATWYFAIKAYNSKGTESVLSGTRSKTVQ